jgi:hypothetical protein
VTRRLSILAFVLVLAIASLGLAYGAWSQTLTINGTANTGTLEAHFETLVVPTDWYAKFDGSTISADGKTLTLNVTNVYPGFSQAFTFDVENGGSIPVVVPAIELQGKPAWLNVAYAGCPQTTLAAGAKETCTVTLSMSENETGNMTQSGSLTSNLTVTQFTGH